ncbi:glycoside hydrolase family 15 protein [Sphingobacterium corticibacter]|uniref:Glucoamylase n=1 Tax=Sphingobacterium corticibacter TaxID=2171749 RepID=A0A2T8HIW2_9SPHI|nr:glycoside hydrolase family 15 protein [Sphingobacterium corticibacter]PVH25310.1 glucoamylase [Sphingobacterium corticibacter]
MRKKSGYPAIEDHGVIGNMHTAALVALDGTIDFMCFPKFDSPTIFGSLLDKDKGGYFGITPEMKDVNVKQIYIPGTAVLITRFFSEDGIVEITDYMPVIEDSCFTFNAIVRKVKAIRGNIKFKMQCKPRFGYAKVKHTAERMEDGIHFSTKDNGQSTVRLSSTVDMTLREHDAYASFTLEEGKKSLFVLETAKDGDLSQFKSIEEYGIANYFATIKYWRDWLKQSNYQGRWQEIIHRSAITLKLMTSMQYGSTVAAITFGLPEEIGGDRNWDYRFTWIRDAAFSMYAFLKLGFKDEAKAFLDWIITQDKDRDLHLLYRVDGTSEMEEQDLTHLEGYKQSKPVRIGNEANNQLQLDIYGELLDTIYIYNKMYKPITYELWEIIVKEIAQVEKRWNEPDHGIWEIRNEKHEFLHSRLMCWVAIDRAIKIGQDRSFPYDAERWHNLRNDIYKDIYENFWNDDIKAWVQYKDGKKTSDRMDASALLMPLVHFITPDEPRWEDTMKELDEKLRIDVLVYRYLNDEGIDGLGGEEGTFTMCSFWYIEVLAKMGRVDEAVENFEKMLSYGNHLGLFAEQISKKGEHLGNFPQAFTHLGLISAALELNKQIGRQTESLKKPS